MLPLKVIKSEEKDNSDVIMVSSDDDISPVKTEIPHKEDSNSSQSTVIYNPTTPQKTPQSSTRSSTFHSSSSSNKFYSPNKKRLVTKRSPAKRKLIDAFSLQSPQNHNDDDSFAKACDNLNDKTIFLLRIINDFLNNEMLKNLLDEQSRTLLSKSFEVLKPGMGLVCRLYWRHDGWYKIEKLKTIMAEKVKMGDPMLESMLKSLLLNGFVNKTTADEKLRFEEYVGILKYEDIKIVCKDFKLKPQKNKADTLRILKNFSVSTSSIANWCKGTTNSNIERVLNVMGQKAGVCYKLSNNARLALNKLHILMYLGIDYNLIREKKLEFALINDKAKVEVYPIDKEMSVDNASVVFNSQDEFERYYKAHCLYEDFLGLETDPKTMRNVETKCCMVKDVFTKYNEILENEMRRYKSLPPWLRRFTPPNIYIKILENGIMELKRSKDNEMYSLALDILNTLISQTAFRQHRKMQWYEEKAKILHKFLHNFDQAAETLLEAFSSDMCEEDQDHLRPRALVLADQLNTSLDEHVQAELKQHANKDTILERNISSHHIYAQYEESYKKGKQKFRTWTKEGELLTEDAEAYCCRYYIENRSYTHGNHWEGRIVTTLFFLLFWDIIYSKPPGVSGVFLSHYQRYPLDLFHEHFYLNRKPLIEDKLKEITTSSIDQLLAKMDHTWQNRPEGELSGIERSIGWENVRDVTACLGPRGVGALCRRLAVNYRYARSGFPDLTLWNVHTKQIKFVEVKTDADKPSMKQKQWMQYLGDNDIATEFCYIGVNTTRSKARSGPS